MAASDRDEAQYGSGLDPEVEQMEPLLTTNQVAALFGIPAKTLSNWRSLRQGPDFVRIGVHVRYRQSAVEAWVNERTAETISVWRAS